MGGSSLGALSQLCLRSAISIFIGSYFLLNNLLFEPPVAVNNSLYCTSYIQSTVCFLSSDWTVVDIDIQKEAA